MKNSYFHIEILISATHMLGAMLLSEKNKKMCDLVRLGVYFALVFVISLYRTI